MQARPWQRIRGGLDAGRWRALGLMAGVVVALHVAGFALLLLVIAPRHLALGDGGAFTVGIGLTAYTLGLRHAIDADHIGAIDATTRKLMADGRRPVSVGFFFSLGHSTVVFALALAVTAGIRGLGGAVADDGSWLHRATGVIGPGVSGTFLILIGVLNLLVLVGIVDVLRRLRRGACSEAELEARLAGGGPLARVYGRATGAVTEPWQMYLVGLLFGLGFDTATEVALLATAGAAAAGGLPVYAVLCLPILFAAGMALLDTVDGAFMHVAYDWAFARPVRRLYYNLTVTWLSVVVALAIGTIELMSVLADRLALTGQPWDFVSGVDLGELGAVIAAVFVVTWALALGLWRFGRIEERWSPAPASGPREAS